MRDGNATAGFSGAVPDLVGLGKLVETLGVVGPSVRATVRT
jgi:hypothetical protein